uniref:Ig-like domain-containing protein n=1 Tax=Catharus ustulatus TaxID=91951 RepID=A0A8C3TIA4_CATUS
NNFTQLMLYLYYLKDFHFHRGQTADVITQPDVVHALPGTDVTLVCMFPKPPTTHIIQTQWSKIEDDSPSTKIAVHHPTYGTHYFTSWWALHLENVTLSLSGQYECTFATYPYGTKAAKIQLTVKAEGK